jgi:hypothetical protein
MSFIEDVQEVCREAGFTVEQVSKAVKIAREIQEAKKAERESSSPKSKNRFVVLVRGDEALKTALAGGAWVVQVADEADSALIQPSLIAAAARQNDGKAAKTSNRGRKAKGGRIGSWAELFSWAKTKFTKQVGAEQDRVLVKIKNKEPAEVQVIITEDVPFSELKS